MPGHELELQEQETGVSYPHALCPVRLSRDPSLNTLLQPICPRLGGHLSVPSVEIHTWVTSMGEFTVITC